ncbi:MAG: hypothetical protein K8W52_12870, partial [Deltaproteobacteria bacterium]|nr:hypothetical protein [Deltaproteobacteria bacterium]
MRILRAALASGLLLASGGARASGTQSVQCTGNPAADGAALVKAFHDINLANGGVIVLAEKCVYGLTSPAPVEDLGFWFGPTGLPVVTSTIVVEGNGSTIKPVGPTSGGVRLIAVAGPAGQIPGSSPAYPHAGNLTLRNLTLTGGKAQGGHGASSAVRSGGGGAGLGGAAFVQGSLTLDAVTIRECTAYGGNGGVTFLAADPTGNGGGGGLGGDGGDGGGGFAGAGAIAGGGAVTDAAGATPGDWGTAPSPWGLGTPANGRGGDATDPGGGFGGGGAFVSGALGGAGGVGGGGGGCTDTGACTGGNGGFGGGGGAGNAIDGALGGVSLFGGGNGAPNSGAPGFGGGLAGTSANGAPAAGGGGAGLGGAIFVHGGTLTVRNSTFLGNAAQGGAGGTLRANGFQIQGSDGGAGYGGAIFVLNGTVSIASSTFDNNVVIGGYGGDGAVPGANGPSVGAIYAAHLDLGGVPVGPTMVTIANTIVSWTFALDAPPAADCGLTGGAMLVSGDTNLVKVPGECVFAGAGDLTGVDPMLTAIADNGG